MPDEKVCTHVIGPALALASMLASATALAAPWVSVPAKTAPSMSAPAFMAPALPPEALSRLDARLLPAALVGRGDPVSVWVSFADKGERSPGELALALARAAAELSPLNRARRERCGVRPLVDYQDLPLHAPYVAALLERGLQPYGQSRWFNHVAVRVPPARLAEIASLSFVRHVRPVERAFRSRDLPAEPDAPVPQGGARPPREAGQDGLGSCDMPTSINYGSNAAAVTQMNVPAVHDSGYIGTGVLVCIIDDGFNYHNKQEALRPVVIAPGFERDFVDGDSVASDTTSTCCRHGAYVMGCVAGNLPGKYVGTAPGAKYALARTEVDASETPVEMVNWGMGAEWADSLGADVITSSLGYNQFDGGVGDYTFADMNGHTTIVSRAAEIAASKGILVVNAAGNEGANLWQKVIAPADVNGDSLIAVGAVDMYGTIASFSSRGPTADGRIAPEVCALGVSNSLVSANGPPQGYMSGSGTSFATPLTAGLVACLVQARPSFTPQMIIRALRETASRASTPDTVYGYGIVNGLAALRWAPPAASALPGGFRLALTVCGSNPLRLGEEARVTFALGADAPPAAQARLSVYDAQGRRVRDLFQGMLGRWTQLEAQWNGTNDNGQTLPAGLYFVALDAAGKRASARLVWLR